ncbi:MAG: DUF305 domain-containing protein [Alphaproteobacteria bacterium]|nr:DUF305 domain-containing protein [Alphaproteobacteria bacterium]
MRYGFKILSISLFGAACVLSSVHPAQAIIEQGYSHDQVRATIPWYVIGNDQERLADLNFIEGMRPHHAGALSMSEEYLADPDARNARLKQLAGGIIHNQTFEIAIMDMIEGHQKGNADAPDGSWRQVSERDMDQKLKFYRAPMPGPLDRFYGDQGVSKRDVEFAKSMIIHHEGALVMAQDYLDGPHSNGYLARLCLDILTDQAQEIAYMHSIINEYAGNPDEIKIDASMIHGMDGMAHMMLDGGNDIAKGAPHKMHHGH